MQQRLLLAILLLSANLVLAQNNKPVYLQGYAAEAGGKRFAYHSPFSSVTPALILRGQADYPALEWTTEAVPANYAGQFVHFIWMFGMDVTPDPVSFRLSANGQQSFNFESSRTSKTGWTTIDGAGGAALSLNVTMLDKYQDQMGFAILKLPVSAVRKGEPVRLTLETATKGNNSWFMTFKTEVKDKIEVYQNSVVVKDKGQLWHSVSLDFIHTGEDAETSITVAGQKINATLKAGFNKVEVKLPKVDKPTAYKAVIRKAGSAPVTKSFTLAPVREWEIHLIQHTHTDIGYTRPQMEILPEHLRYIDHALDFCDQTDDYPDAAKFRWTCETAWSVREYLRTRPQAQIDRLLQRIKEGRIEATGMFLNFAETADEAALAAQTKTLRMLKNKGIDVTTLMQNDVNGIAWCLVDYYNTTDVKYVNMGVHAHRAQRPFAIPTAFWWQSPAGNRLLAFRAEHYMMGNMLALTSGQMDVFRTNLADYLKDLANKNYPYDKVALQFSGYTTDNSPPSVKVCDIIREWNEKYEWPKLRSSLVRDFMIYLDEHHANDIATQKVAWPDWWTDGFGSAANETKVVRNAQDDLSATTAVLAMARLLGVQLPEGLDRDLEAVNDNILFYDEHTHGAAESISDPRAQNTVNQWGMKSAYAWDAAKRSSALQEKALAYIESGLGKSAASRIAIFNTLNWQRSGVASLFIPFEVIPSGADFTITDAEGREVPAQMHEIRGEGAYYELWVEDLPPMGYKTLQVNVGQKPKRTAPANASPFENQFYRLRIDEKKGILTGIFDKALQKELVDPRDSFSLGQLIYEQLSNRHDLERLTQTNRDTVYRPLDLTRDVLQNVKLVRTANGPIYQSIFLHGDLPVCADARGVELEIRLYHYQKKIGFHYKMIKLPVFTPEGLYVSFPFHLDKGRLAFEAQGGVVYPGINQLEGSASDWNTIQNFAAVKNDQSQIVFVSKDIPLVHFGALNIGRYYYRLQPKTNHIFSWVLNNYWVTNFKASQEGELRWSYSITSSADNSDLFATKFGWGDRAPLLSRVILPGKGGAANAAVTRSLIDLGAPNLLLVNAAPSETGPGIVLHIREVDGRPAVLDIQKLRDSTKASSVQEVSVLEEERAKLSGSLQIKPYETKFIKINQ